MTAAQRRKGADAEREFAELLREHGFACERLATMYARVPDLHHDVPGVHFEIRRRERLDLPGWMRDAERDAGYLEPVVAYRRSREPWRCVVNASYLLGLLRRS